jgi:ComF family protein
MDPLIDLFSLLFPNLCTICGNTLLKHESVICTFCDYHLPRTNFHLNEQNQVFHSFLGRIKIETCGAFLYFNKGNRVQDLIHQLKYKGRKDIGEFLGKQYGCYLKNVPDFQSIDWIVPVPIHKKRLKIRGYNQSESFAAGLAISLGTKVDSTTVIRKTQTTTQTKKTRFRRWENVEGIFFVRNPKKFEYKHVLVVDDVITTGATLESCITSLSTIPGIKVSVATIAITQD